uniref:Exocyst complex component 7 n=1 Tax=Sinocyclocheilus anshuiensis TaxID=1608454 RepID=A0A671KWD6_9TELE
MIPTEDASARKREIEDKLKQEQETLSFIRESLEKSDQLTKGMVSILSSFESRLMQLENSIIPVHKQTENLQRLQENVDKTLSCLDHVISYYHVAKDTDKIIREGPAGRLDEYLACIAKIQKAVEYFQDNNPDSPELNTVKARFEKGKELLEAEFRSLLTRYSKPVPPILILDAIGGDEDMEVQEDVTLEHLPEAVLQDIICISAWLVEYGRNQDFMNVYFQVRSSQLDRSIKGLKEHFRKNSATSAMHSPAVQTKRKETPTKKPPKRPEYNMPKDGTVHELTSNAILFLQQLLDFQETAGAMLASQGKAEPQSCVIFIFYCLTCLILCFTDKVLGNLQLNLSNKAKVYEDPALRAVFLHNNYNYILKSLEKSELIQLVAVTHKKVEGSYRELIEQEIQNYQRSWLKVTEHLTERNIPAFQPGTKLKDKERQIIKDKFKGFNEGLEELCKIQQGWAVPDKEQRDAIRQAEKRVVSEAYRAFLQRCANISFTKNPEKYHRYSPEQVEEMIDKLFDTSA